jgi:hypothetical protein
MRMSRETFPLQIMTDQKQLENVGGIITNGTKCKHEIKSKIAMAKAAFN